MAKRKRKKKQFTGQTLTDIIKYCAIAVLAAAFIIGVLNEMGIIRISSWIDSGDTSQSEGSSIPEEFKNSEVRVHYIDVGQGDSIFIEAGPKTILIDAGEKEYGQKVSDYISELGYDKLDIVIATHPHSDHIGGLPEVLGNFEIGTVIMPKIADDMVPTTKVYEKLLAIISDKNIKAAAASDSLSFVWSDSAGEKIMFRILGPVTDKYKDLNNYSVVSKLTYNDVSFLFTGDMEDSAEEDLIYSGADLKATVLKVGHHGSSTSSSPAFLKKVSPLAAVIQCGKDNSYGHPHEETLEKLSKYTDKIYRTDENGTILIITDGKTVVAVKEKNQ